DLYLEQEPQFKAQILRCATVQKNLVVLDLRQEPLIHAGNRFMVYALFPPCNISIHVMWGLRQQNTVLATGKSIFNRTSPINIGELMLKYGGGGHNAAGTCQVENSQADQVLAEIISQINQK
ncbi:MAG: exopolyphosphatase, partial [Kovacikia sp.]